MSTTPEDLLRERRRRNIPVQRRTAVYVYQAPLRRYRLVHREPAAEYAGGGE